MNEKLRLVTLAILLIIMTAFLYMASESIIKTAIIAIPVTSICIGDAIWYWKKNK